MHTSNALSDFIERTFSETPAPPVIAFDPEWPSVCYTSSNVQEGDLIPWSPVKQEQPTDMFDRLAEALGIEIHHSIVSFYTTYWSEHLPARSPWGDLTLLQLWNEEDAERLRANLVGHSLQLKRKRLTPSVFIACFEQDDEQIISADTYSGEVYIENIGRKRRTLIANTIADFIQQLTPAQFS